MVLTLLMITRTPKNLNWMLNLGKKKKTTLF